MERHKKNTKKNHKISKEEDWIIKIKNEGWKEKTFEEKIDLKGHDIGTQIRW
jgi:hypothetical protein